MNEKLKRTRNNFIFSLLSQLVTIALGLIIPRITMIGYGSDVNGLLNSVTQFVAYLILFEAGVQSVATQSLYKTIGENDKTATNEILAAVHKNYRKIGLIYFLGLLALSFVYPLFTVSDNISYPTIFFVVLFSGLGNVVSFFFQGKYKILLIVEGKSYIITNISTIISLLNNIAKILLLYLGLNVAIVIFSTFLISMLQTVYILLYIKSRYKWIDLSAKPCFSALKQSKAALIHQISGLIFNNTDTLLLTIICGLKVVSVYSMYKLVCDSIFNFLKVPYESCSFALGQSFNTDKNKFIEQIDIVEILLATLAFAVFTVVFRLLLPFIALYTKGVTDITYVDNYLAILFVAYELLNWVRMPMLNTINYAGHFKETLSRTITESAINIIVSLIGVFWIGIYGVLIGTIAALLYRSTDIIIYANKILLNRSPLRTFGIYLSNATVMVGVSLILKYVQISINSYLDFIVAGLIITPIVLVVFFLISIFIYRKDYAKLFFRVRNRSKT